MKSKVKELLRDALAPKRVNKMIDSILRENPELLDEYEDSYKLPKAVVVAISKQLTADYQPLAEERDRMEKFTTHLYNSIWNV